MSFDKCAPGRLDFMGGVGDYSGGLVLQVATHVQTVVSCAINPRKGLQSMLTLASASFGTSTLNLDWLVSALGESPSSAPEFLTAIRGWLDGLPEKPGKWVYYVFGSLASLALECHSTSGDFFSANDITLTISSKVPLGQGVSSSASIEVATIRALRAAMEGKGVTCLPSDLRVSHLAQKAENHAVGAPCGLMDQLASSLGSAGKILPILCRPDCVESLVALPTGILVVGWPSGVEHSLQGISPYSLARTSSFMAKKLLEGLTGRKVAHLTEFAPSTVLELAVSLPEKLFGADFLKLHDSVDDALSLIDPGVEYGIRAAALFPVQENFR